MVVFFHFFLRRKFGSCLGRGYNNVHLEEDLQSQTPVSGSLWKLPLILLSLTPGSQVGPLRTMWSPLVPKIFHTKPFRELQSEVCNLRVWI